MQGYRHALTTSRSGAFGSGARGADFCASNFAASRPDCGFELFTPRACACECMAANSTSNQYFSGQKGASRTSFCRRSAASAAARRGSFGRVAPCCCDGTVEDGALPSTWWPPVTVPGLEQSEPMDVHRGRRWCRTTKLCQDRRTAAQGEHDAATASSRRLRFRISELMFYEIHTCIFSSGLIALVCLSASKPAIRRYEAGPPEDAT